MHPWPGAYFFWQNDSGKKLRIGLKPGRIGEPLERETSPGQILGCQGEDLAIACADKAYLVPSVRPEGKRDMNGQAFECGYMGRDDCGPDESL